MSKGNLFLGFGRGSVGDVTLYHQDGEQIARARNRSPRNPKTALQLLQRVVLKTSSMGYSLFQDICNHSFQGAAEGTESQARFNKANIAWMREQLAPVINSGSQEDIYNSTDSNYSFNGASLVEFMPFIISEGSLSKLPIIWGKDLSSPAFIINVNLGKAAPSYAEVVEALGIQGGDQLTFCACSIDDTDEGGQFNGFEYGRVIMSPSGGDATVPFLNGESINEPNEKNDGQFAFSIVQVSSAYYLTFRCTKYSNSANVANAMAAGTVILSRQNGGVWQRSPQQLVLRPYTVSVSGHLQYDHAVDLLGDAVLSFMESDSSTLYLNQAEHGGGTAVVDTCHITKVEYDGAEMPAGVLSNVGTWGSLLKVTVADKMPGKSYAIRLDATGSEGTPQTLSGNSVQWSPSLPDEVEYKVNLVADGIVIQTYCRLWEHSDM